MKFIVTIYHAWQTLAKCSAFLLLISLLPNSVLAQIETDGADELIAVNYAHHKPDSIFLAAKEAYLTAVNSKNAISQGKQLGILGELCYHQGQFPKALDYYLDERKVWAQLGRKDKLAEVYNRLGILYFYNHNQAKAQEYYRLALHIYTNKGNQGGIAVTLGHIGHLLEKQQAYDSAQLYQQRALNMYELVKDSIGIALTQGHLGSIQEDLGIYDKAMSHFQKALTLYQGTANELRSIEVVNNIGDIFRKTGNYTIALQYSLTALQLANKHGELYQTCSAYRDISKTYHLLQRDDSAYHYSEIARAVLLNIYSIENNKQMAFLQVLDETERTNNELNSLRHQKKLTVIVTTATIVFILLLVLASVMTISRQRIKLRSEQQANAQHEELYNAQQMLMEAQLKAAAIEEQKLKAELRNKQLEKDKLNAALKNRQYEEQELKRQIEMKEKGLSTQVLHVIQKNQLLDTLKSQLETIVSDDKRDQKRQMRSVIQLINQNFNNDSNWEEFSHNFEHIHQSFFTQLHQLYPGLTAAELKLVSLLKMNLDAADMATMLGISQDSLRVARYRLRKKLNLEQGKNLVIFLQSIPT